MPTDWQELDLSTTSPAVVDPRLRLRWCVAAFAVFLLIVWCRAAELQVGQGAAFREAALRPIHRENPLPAPRGRILARDGTVLACDRIVNAVAVDYRWLEDPPRQAWLEQLARKRLLKDQRRNGAQAGGGSCKTARRARRTAQKTCRALHHRPSAMASAARRVQERVERIAAGVQRRQIETARSTPQSRADASWSDRVSNAFHEIFEPARDAVPAVVTVAEELSEHEIAEDVPAAAVAEIQSHADKYPGTRVVQLTQRFVSAWQIGGARFGISWTKP